MISKLPASMACLRNPLIKIKKEKNTIFHQVLGLVQTPLCLVCIGFCIKFLMALQTQHEFNVTKICVYRYQDVGICIGNARWLPWVKENNARPMQMKDKSIEDFIFHTLHRQTNTIQTSGLYKLNLIPCTPKVYAQSMYI